MTLQKENPLPGDRFAYKDKEGVADHIDASQDRTLINLRYDVNLMGGDDYFNGGNLDDDIIGGYGNDTLKGGGGDDEIRGGANNDTIDGNRGDDRIHGDEGDDKIYWSKGNDTVYGGEGHDRVWIYSKTGDPSEFSYWTRSEPGVNGLVRFLQIKNNDTGDILSVCINDVEELEFYNPEIGSDNVVVSMKDFLKQLSSRTSQGVELDNPITSDEASPTSPNYRDIINPPVEVPLPTSDRTKAEAPSHLDLFKKPVMIYIPDQDDPPQPVVTSTAPKIVYIPYEDDSEPVAVAPAPTDVGDDSLNIEPSSDPGDATGDWVDFDPWFEIPDIGMVDLGSLQPTGTPDADVSAAGEGESDLPPANNVLPWDFDPNAGFWGGMAPLEFLPLEEPANEQPIVTEPLPTDIEALPPPTDEAADAPLETEGGSDLPAVLDLPSGLEFGGAEPLESLPLEEATGELPPVMDILPEDIEALLPPPDEVVDVPSAGAEAEESIGWSWTPPAVTVQVPPMEIFYAHVDNFAY